jgi:hypothetical protein
VIEITNHKPRTAKKNQRNAKRKEMRQRQR